MGLLDWFKKGSPQPIDAEASLQTRLLEEWGKRARLEAEVERLHLEWASYKDEMKRLVQRLEKRDQRAAAREAAEEPPAEAESPEVAGYRMLRERRGHGILQGRR